jgi:thiol-disulfide isomerase/thioredoxin
MPGMKHGPAVAGLAVVACVALAAGYHFGRDRGASPGEPPGPPTAQPVPAVRPLFSLTDSGGELRSIADWDGRSLMINFWATWCPPCRREIPLLNSLRAEYGPRGFEVIGVAVDFREDVLAYMRETPIDYPVLIGEQDGIDAARAFGMETMGFPFTIFTDREGRIVTVHVGELHAAEADAILAAVGEVVAGRSTIDAARTRIRADLAALDPGKG